MIRGQDETRGRIQIDAKPASAPAGRIRESTRRRAYRTGPRRSHSSIGACHTR